MASRAALALAPGALFLLVAACEASPAPTSNQGFQGATVTAKPSTSPRTEASTTAGVSDIRLIEEAGADLVLYVSDQSFEDSPVIIQVATAIPDFNAYWDSTTGSFTLRIDER